MNVAAFIRHGLPYNCQEVAEFTDSDKAIPIKIHLMESLASSACTVFWCTEQEIREFENSKTAR